MRIKPPEPSDCSNGSCASLAGLIHGSGLFAIIFIERAVGRYSIGKSLPWGEELPIYLTIYGVMFGSLRLAYMQDRHIRFFTLVTDMLSPRGA